MSGIISDYALNYKNSNTNNRRSRSRSRSPSRGRSPVSPRSSSADSESSSSRSRDRGYISSESSRSRSPSPNNIYNNNNRSNQFHTINGGSGNGISNSNSNTNIMNFINNTPTKQTIPLPPIVKPTSTSTSSRSSHSSSSSSSRSDRSSNTLKALFGGSTKSSSSSTSSKGSSSSSRSDRDSRDNRESRHSSSKSSSSSSSTRNDKHTSSTGGSSSSRNDKYSSSSSKSGSSSSSRSDKLLNSIISGSSSSSRSDRDSKDSKDSKDIKDIKEIKDSKDSKDKDKNRDYKDSRDYKSSSGVNKQSSSNQPISSSSSSSTQKSSSNIPNNTLFNIKPMSQPQTSNFPPTISMQQQSSTLPTLPKLPKLQNSSSTPLYNQNNNQNSSPKPSPSLKPQSSSSLRNDKDNREKDKNKLPNLVPKKTISKKDREQLMELLNEHDSDSDIDFTTTPTLSSHISKYSPAQSPLPFKSNPSLPLEPMSNSNRGGSSSDNLYSNNNNNNSNNNNLTAGGFKNLDLNNTNDQNKLDNFLLSTENPDDIKSAFKPIQTTTTTTTSGGQPISLGPKPLDLDSDDEISEEYYRKMLIDHSKSKKSKKIDSDKFFKELELSDDDVFNEKNDKKQLKIMKRLMDKESSDRTRVRKKMTDPKYSSSSSRSSNRDKYKSKYPSLYGSSRDNRDRKDKKSSAVLSSDDDFNMRDFSDEDEEEFERMLKMERKKKKSSSLNSSLSGIKTDQQQYLQQQQLLQSQQIQNFPPQPPTSQMILEKLDFYKNIDSSFANNWARIIKKELPKSQKRYMDTHINGLSDCKKRSSMMKKEIKSRYQKANQKLNTKDIQLRAKKLVKEMGAYWRKFDKDEREAKKRAEKEEANQRKRDEEIQEAKRQQRKLNFLISQTELYSHFMSKKLETGEEEESETMEKPKKPKKEGEEEESSEEEESDDEENKTEQEKQEEAQMKEEALKKTQKAIELQLQKTKNFDQDVHKIKSTQTTDKLFDESSNNLLDINNQSSIPPGFATSDTLKQPTILNADLKPYQLKGMTWIVNLYDQGINGILADEMGLGKTIQSIAVLAHLAEEKNIWGPFLIVTPKSTLHNWKNEFAKFVPHFKVIPYWGTQQQRTTIRKYWNPKKLYHRNSPFHVLITSYNVIVRDEKYFHRLRWQYMVLDEAHAIKSSASNRWKTLMSFNCRNRLLLTGTPIQNSMAELWALLHFIMPTFFDSHDEFAEWFSKDIENHAMSQGGLNEHQLNRLHMILKPFMLRRVKKDVENEMPSKTEIEVYCNLTHRQKRLYQSIRQKLSLTELLGGASFSEVSMSALMNLVMQFRKVCNHPETFKRSECESPFLFQIQDMDPINATLPVTPQTPYYQRVVKCINNNPIQIKYPKLLYRDLWQANQTNQHLVEKYFNIFNSNNIVQSNQDTFSFLDFVNLSPSDLENLNSNFTIMDFYIYNQVLEKEIYPVLNYCYDQYKDSDNLSITMKSMLLEPTFTNKLKDYRLFNGLNQFKELVLTPDERCQLNQDIIQSVYTLYPKVLATPIDIVVPDKRYYLERLNEQFDTIYSLPSTFSELPSEISLLKLTMNGIESPSSSSNQNITTAKSLVKSMPTIVNTNYQENVLNSFTENGGLMGELNHLFGSTSIWMPSFSKSLNDSGKLQVLDKLLKQLKDGGHRVLIYSQFTKMINILEDFMIYRKYKYLRLDGSSKLEDRRDMVDDFQSDSSIFAFLLSTRACGIGINLTSADTVVFYDSDWNPTVDEQAMDRCHRLGQQRPVTVYRLITKGTIEEKILKRAKQKHHIQSIVIAGGKFESANPDDMDQMGQSEVASLLLDDDELEERSKKRKQPEPEEKSLADKPFSPNDIPITKIVNKGRPPKEKDPSKSSEPKVPKKKGPKPGFKRIKADPNANSTSDSNTALNPNDSNVTSNQSSTTTTTTTSIPTNKNKKEKLNEDGTPRKPGRPAGKGKGSFKKSALNSSSSTAPSTPTTATTTLSTPTTPILSNPTTPNSTTSNSPK